MSGLLDVVMGFEGWNPKAYGDYKQWSVGYGTKAKHPGEVIDQEEGRRRLEAELNQARGYVTQKFPNLAPNQADALTSFTYNLGPGWMSQPTRLRAALEKGDAQTAAQVMQLYNKAGGEVLPGLVKRRASEAAMFLGGPVPSGSPVASSPSPQGAAPSMDNSQEKPFSLAGLLAEKLNNPLFLMGASLYGAGRRGTDPGTGLVQGAQVAQEATKAQMQQDALRRKLAAQQAQDKLWSGLEGNAAALGMTPEQARALTIAGPEAGRTVLAQILAAQADPTAKARLELLKGQTEAQRAEMETLPYRRRLLEAQASKAEADAKRKELGPEAEYETRARVADQLGIVGDARKSYIATGKMGREVDAQSLKYIYQAQDEMPILDSAISQLEEAKDLVGKAYSGGIAPVTASRLNQALPDWLPDITTDRDRAKATLRYDQLMSEQAVAAMSAALKGATTDTELKEFKTMMADPRTPDENKMKMIEGLLNKARRHREILNARIEELGGKRPSSGAATRGGAQGGDWSIKRID